MFSIDLLAWFAYLEAHVSPDFNGTIDEFGDITINHIRKDNIPTLQWFACLIKAQTTATFTIPTTIYDPVYDQTTDKSQIFVFVLCFAKE